MNLQHNVFDVWPFRRRGAEVEYLLLHTSQEKADRHFNGARYWQIPSNIVAADETIVEAIDRRLADLGLTAGGIWAAEHVYTIYNRRFACMQIIGVYAAEIASGEILLDPAEHAESRWCTFDEALGLVRYRGLKDGLRSTQEYVTGAGGPLRELQLR